MLKKKNNEKKRTKNTSANIQGNNKFFKKRDIRLNKSFHKTFSL